MVNLWQLLLQRNYGFSFHPVKLLPLVRVVWLRPMIPAWLDVWRNYVVMELLKIKVFERSSPGPWSYEQQDLGFNYRMTDIQAALGLSQLQRLDQIVMERNRQLQLYRSCWRIFLSSCLRCLSMRSVLCILQLFVCSMFLVSSIGRCLRDCDPQVSGCSHYSPVHLHPYYRAMGFKEGLFPQSELYSRSAMSLLCFPALLLRTSSVSLRSCRNK